MKIFNVREGFATNSSSMHSIVEIQKNPIILLSKRELLKRGQHFNFRDTRTCPHCEAEDMTSRMWQQQDMEKGQVAKVKCTCFGGDGCSEFYWVMSLGAKKGLLAFTQDPCEYKKDEE